MSEVKEEYRVVADFDVKAFVDYAALTEGELRERIAELEGALKPFANTYDVYQRVIKEPGYGPLFSLDQSTYAFHRAWELLKRPGTKQGQE